MRRPRLRPTVTVVDGGDGSVHLLHPGFADTALRDAGAGWAAFLRALDGSGDAAGALARAGPAARGIARQGRQPPRSSRRRIRGAGPNGGGVSRARGGGASRRGPRPRRGR